MTVASRLVEALRDPSVLAGFTIDEWELVVRQGRRANVLGRLATALADRGMLHAVPEGPRAHLEAARLLGEAQQGDVRREVDEVRAALAPLGVRCVLLKGAAYVMADLPAARGRLFSDIDILVPRERLPEVESALMLRGWAATHHEPYDQRYYRRWMHELPPMQHVQRCTTLDVHHAILPVTARLRPHSATLLADARAIPGHETLWTLSPPDMVLHSATHLFYNEDLESGLRDLVDLDLLLCDFARDDAFWPALAARAGTLGLERPLWYALRHAHRLYGTPVPEGWTARGAPLVPVRRAMDALYGHALQAHPMDATDAAMMLARQTLYVRAHWLRMPPWLLAWHLAHKALRRERPESAQKKPAQP